jgi:FkbM family methyltransferase
VKLLTRNASRLRRLAHLLESPQEFQVWRQGLLADTFRKLNRPWFRQMGIRTFLDIGANVGQFAATINYLLPEVKIYAFEPLPDCFELLCQRMKGKDNFRAFNIGCGEANGVQKFNRNSFTPSSSFLKMKQSHIKSFPYTSLSTGIDVNIGRLDELASQLEIKYRLAAKIDVQGYEDRVLKGGESTLKLADLIIIETSFVELYENQVLFEDVFKTLVSWGFIYAGSISQLESPADGKILQADSLFVKEGFRACLHGS